MGFNIAELVGKRAGLGLMADTERATVERALADHLAQLVIEFRDQMLGIFTRLGLGIAHDHVDAQPVVERAAITLGHRVHIAHPLGDLFLGFGPHQVDIAMLAAQLQRIGRIAPEIQKRPARLIGPRRVGRHPRELVNLALVVDGVARPGLLEDFDHLARALIAKGAVGHLARKIGRDDIHRQPPLQHVIERGDGARQHDRLHLATAHGGQKIDLVGDRRAARHETQRVLAHLVGGGAQDIAKPVRLGTLHDLRAMRPA